MHEKIKKKPLILGKFWSLTEGEILKKLTMPGFKVIKFENDKKVNAFLTFSLTKKMSKNLV